MWSKKAIERIVSALGVPILAKANELPNSRAPPSLEVCIIVNKDFRYLDFVKAKIQGGANQEDRFVTMEIENDSRKPFCHQCQCYGHWTSLCDD